MLNAVTSMTVCESEFTWMALELLLETEAFVTEMPSGVAFPSRWYKQFILRHAWLNL